MKNLSAYIGIAGALGMAVSDVILLGQPVSGSYFDMSSFGAMNYISPLRAAIGAGGGLVCSFFICFGFWFLKTKFETINARLAMVLFISFCSMMFFGGAFHAAYFFIANPTAGLPMEDISRLPTHHTMVYLEALSYIGVPGFIAGSVLFFRLAGDARFPAWYRFCNPLLLCGLFLVVFMLVPAPFGGYLKPTFVNLATASLFLISLRVRTPEMPIE